MSQLSSLLIARDKLDGVDQTELSERAKERLMNARMELESAITAEEVDQ